MSKKIYLFSLVLLSLVFASCSETEEVGRYDNWRARSEAFIDSIANVHTQQQVNNGAGVPEEEKLYAFTDMTNLQTIYAKKRKGVDEGESPVYTSTISAYYRMRYFNGDLVQQNFKEDVPGEFDSPAEFQVNSLITGWAYSLVHMKVGEFWTIYIPYQSGYGSGTGSDGSLEAYSALIYDVQIDRIVKK